VIRELPNRDHRFLRDRTIIYHLLTNRDDTDDRDHDHDDNDDDHDDNDDDHDHDEDDRDEDDHLVDDDDDHDEDDNTKERRFLRLRKIMSIAP